jgi:hypothetical protein
MEKDLIPAAGKKAALELLPKQCPPQTKEAWGFYSDSLCIFI